MSPQCPIPTWWMAGASGAMKAAFSLTWRTTAFSRRISPCRIRRASTPERCGCSIRAAAISAGSTPRAAKRSRWRSARASRAGFPSGAAMRYSAPRCRAPAPSRGSSLTITSRRGTASRAAAPTSSTPAPATSCIGSVSRAPCASCSTRRSFPACARAMCVGLGNPEMRTLITFAGDTTSSEAEVAA